MVLEGPDLGESRQFLRCARPVAEADKTSRYADRCSRFARKASGTGRIIVPRLDTTQLWASGRRRSGETVEKRATRGTPPFLQQNRCWGEALAREVGGGAGGGRGCLVVMVGGAAAGTTFKQNVLGDS